MKNKVVVTIADRDYTMVAVEDEAYVTQCADLVNSQLREVSNGRLSQSDAAVLAAMNIADQYYKEQANCEHLRAQLKAAMEEASSLKLELSEAKREIFKLQTRKP